MSRSPLHRRGLTLLEMLVSLSILAMLSTVVFSMIEAGASVSSALTTSMSNEWDLEAGLQRIIAQTRQCVSFSVPTGVSGGNSFSVVTAPDPANANQSYNITWSLVTLADGTQQLQETDLIAGTTNPRYATATLPLINNVQSFDVRFKAIGAPEVIVITLTVGTKPGVNRVVKVTPRNQ